MLSNCLITSVFYTFLLFIKQERKANFWVGMEDGPAVRSTCSEQDDHSSDPPSMQAPHAPLAGYGLPVLPADGFLRAAIWLERPDRIYKL